MKKQLLTLAFMFVTICFFSLNSFSQAVPGGEDSGGGDPDGGGNNGSTPDLVINLGSTGTIRVASTSPYYSFVTMLLTALHATIRDGVVTFPTTSCYTRSLSTLYRSGCINNRTYQSACKTPPSGCR